jgi:hypothetical protein
MLRGAFYEFLQEILLLRRDDHGAHSPTFGGLAQMQLAVCHVNICPTEHTSFRNAQASDAL